MKTLQLFLFTLVLFAVTVSGQALVSSSLNGTMSASELNVSDTVGEAKQAAIDWQDGKFPVVSKYRKFTSADR